MCDLCVLVDPSPRHQILVPAFPGTCFVGFHAQYSEVLVQALRDVDDAYLREYATWISLTLPEKVVVKVDVDASVVESVR